MAIPRNDIYSVPPWGDRYYKRLESPSHRRGHFDGYPCAICGKDIPVKSVAHGGIITVDGEWTTDPNHPDSQGWFPVGSQCHRKYVVKNVVLCQCGHPRSFHSKYRRGLWSCSASTGCNCTCYWPEAK